MESRSKIKLCYLFESYPFFYQPYIQQVLQRMKKQDEIDLTIAAFKKNGSTKLGIKYFSSYNRRKYTEFIYKILGMGTSMGYVANKLKKYDIIHIQHSFLSFKFKNLLAIDKHQRPKVVITLRGSDTYIKPWLSPKWTDFYKTAGQAVDAFIVMSSHQKAYLTKWGVKEAQIHVIPISFGESFPARPKKPNKDTLKIYSAYRMLWEKNIDGNLRVIKALAERGLPVHYDIYGEGNDKGQVHFLIDKYQLENYVTYHGKLQNTLLKEKLPNYDFCLQLSHSESLGMSVIEAQTYGIPAIVSNAGGLPEIVTHGKTGYVVASYDAERAADYISDLWNNETSFLDFSEAAIFNSQATYNSDKEVENLMSLYKKLLQN